MVSKIPPRRKRRPTEPLQLQVDSLFSSTQWSCVGPWQVLLVWTFPEKKEWVHPKWCDVNVLTKTLLMGTKLPLLGMGKMFCRDTGWPFLFNRVEWPFGSISVLIAVTEPSARRCVSKIFWFIRDHISANYLNAAQAPRQKNVFWPIQNQHFAFHLAENPLQCTLRITHSQNLCITTFHCRLRCDAGVL